MHSAPWCHGACSPCGRRCVRTHAAWGCHEGGVQRRWVMPAGGRAPRCVKCTRWALRPRTRTHRHKRAHGCMHVQMHSMHSTHPRIHTPTHPRIHTRARARTHHAHTHTRPQRAGVGRGPLGPLVAEGGQRGLRGTAGGHLRPHGRRGAQVRTAPWWRGGGARRVVALEMWGRGGGRAGRTRVLRLAADALGWDLRCGGLFLGASCAAAERAAARRG